jgi:hypothetical protein
MYETDNMTGSDCDVDTSVSEDRPGSFEQKTVSGGEVDVFDWTSLGDPSFAIVDAVATVKGYDEMELSPLNDYVDCDSLDRLLDREHQATDVEVSFRYEELQVTIDSTGEIRIRSSSQ